MLFKSKQFILNQFSKFGYGFCRDLRKSFWKSSIFKIKVINVEQLKYPSFDSRMPRGFFSRKFENSIFSQEINKHYH